MNARSARACRGFTLIEVLVALGIVALALAAGLQAVGGLSRQAERQTLSLLGQMCAENELVRLRLRRQLPDTGNTEKVSRRVNGGTNGLAERIALYEVTSEVLA